MKKFLSIALAVILSLSVLAKLPARSVEAAIPSVTLPSDPTEPTLPQPTEGGVDKDTIDIYGDYEK